VKFWQLDRNDRASMPSRQLLRNKLPNVRRRWSRVDGAGLLALVVVGVLYCWWTLGGQ
jgi:hypothetical protein